MMAENNIITKKKKRSKKKSLFQFKSKSIPRLLALLSVLLVMLVIIELGQVFFQFFRSEASSPRPVYVLDSQPIDFDAYLSEYFATKIPKKTTHLNVTAYSSTNGETDSTPFLTAVGTPVREGVVAANFLPIGTVVRFPDKFGDRIFIVEDRMNERFGLQADIWMANKEEAKEFGIQFVKMEIF
jgi:3D (Asp-Asp-Asp) domain-containing protein